MKTNHTNQPITRQQTGFTLIEVMVTIAIIALLMGILVPALSHARKSANRMKSSTQIGSIHGAFVGYAKDNNEWFPGMDALGRFIAYDYNHIDRENGGPKTSLLPKIAFGLIVNELLIPTGELVSPLEQTGQKQIYQLDDSGNATSSNFTKNNYSYAIMSTGTYTSSAYTRPQRKALWRANGNSQQPMISDRLFGTASIHNTKKAWMGFLGWNDGHVTWENDRYVSTQMSTRVKQPKDDLFSDDNDESSADNWLDNFLMAD